MSGLFINNTSGVTGIHWNKSRKKWQSRIKINGKTTHLGYFNCFIEAVAYRLAAEQCVNWMCHSVANRYIMIVMQSKWSHL